MGANRLKVKESHHLFPIYSMLHNRAKEISTMLSSRRLPSVALAVLLLTLSLSAQVGSRFEITVPAGVHAQPITGRVYVIISRTGGYRFASSDWLMAGRNSILWQRCVRACGRARRRHNHQHARISTTQPEGHTCWRLLRSGAGKCLYRISPCRWPYHLGPHGPVGGAALYELTRQSLQRRAEGTPRSSRRIQCEAGSPARDSTD